ncbi:mitochondrial genome maintenance protein [Russula earlei]|uniref:Mitochondrial genome maintenance protein n=1 Tax=Russula earlei TaxID=71964 RepID=A0ACC0UQD5_9AGAM|nr:mitochondrial genome maintenance protein [Russula earlei]
MFHHLLGSFRAAGLPFPAVFPIRTYVAVGGRSSFRPSLVNKTPPAAARVNTTPVNSTKGNPEKVDTTASEIEADIAAQSEIINDTPIESIPSSGALIVPPLLDAPPTGSSADWSRSYHGLSAQPFPLEVADILQAAIDPLDIEMKPDGMIYLPEIKYRRILNRAFGPGGWGLAPRSETNVSPKIVSREYALVCLGRLVAIARGEQEYFDPSGIPTATEACKSNALMRCCKDLGVASELWDPRFIREFKKEYCVEVYAEHVPTKKKRKLWRRKDQPKFEYPFKE